MAKWTRRLAPSILVLFIFVSGFFNPVYADNESQALVDQGRQLLFGNGDMTVDGLLASRDLFAQAVDKDGTDQDANAFFGATHALAFLYEPGTTGDIDNLGELLAAFGSQRASDSLSDTPLFSDFPEHDGKYDPPAGLPDGAALHTFLAGPFLTRMDEVIAALEVVSDSYTTTITSAETGGDPVQIDQADIKVFRAMAYAARCWALVVTAYDLDFSLADFVQFLNADILQIQRDLLDSYPDLLDLDSTSGTTRLDDARDALDDMIDDYREAHTYIADRIYNYNDWRPLHLFLVEDLKDLNESAVLVNQLTEIQQSLAGNRAASFTTYKEEWIFTEASTGDQIWMKLERDANWTLVSGQFSGMGTCAFLGCNGEVLDARLNGSQITLELKITASLNCGTEATLVGTLSGATISGGTYSTTDCSGPVTGTFSGTRSDQDLTTDVVEFNALFGNTGKAPLDIRAILPTFNADNKPVVDSFPGSPILNGFFPGPNPRLATNDDATRMFNLIDTDTDGDGIIDRQDLFPTDPDEWADNDGDGTGDNADPDDDNDGHADAQDAFPFNAAEWDDTDGDGIGDNADKDDDGDGMPDLWEQRFGLDPLSNDAQDDEDGDGFANKREYLQDTDPTDPESCPSTATPWLPLLLNN